MPQCLRPFQGESDDLLLADWHNAYPMYTYVMDWQKAAQCSLAQQPCNIGQQCTLFICRSCKYVVIKLLRPRGSGDNIDVEYVGLHGWSGRHCCPCRVPRLD